MSNFFDIPIKKHLFVFAILVRFLAMTFLYHPDIKIYNFQSSFLSRGVWNIYEFLTNNKQGLPFREEFVYQPLAYLFWGFFQFLAKPFFGSAFENWLWDASQRSIEAIGIFRFVFLLKLPLLFFDILTAFLLVLFFDDKRDKKRIFALWILNPFLIFIIYAYSGFDIVVSFLVLLSLLFAKRRKFVLSSFFLVLGSLFKAYPLLFLPIVLLRVNKFSDALNSVLVIVGTFCLVSFSFMSSSFLSGALSSGLMTRVLVPSIDLGFGVRIIVPLLLIFIVYILSHYGVYSLETYFFLTGVVILSFIHLHIQWLIWVMPFLLIVFVKEESDSFLVILWFLLMFFLPFLYDDKQMTISLFSLFSRYFTLLPHPFSIVRKVYDPYYLQSIIQTASSSLALFLLWKKLKKMTK